MVKGDESHLMRLCGQVGNPDSSKLTLAFFVIPKCTWSPTSSEKYVFTAIDIQVHPFFNPAHRISSFRLEILQSLHLKYPLD
jgi:hypothetical protein